jgi:hypothetical protein
MGAEATRLAPIAAACVVLATLPMPVLGAQASLDDPERCALSRYVVVGRVAGIDTVWAAAPESGLERRVQFVVEWQGKGPRVHWLEITLPGGVDGVWTHRVEDVPDLTTAKRWGLFLMSTARGLEVVGGGSGAVPIAESADWGAGVPERAFRARAAVCGAR